MPTPIQYCPLCGSSRFQELYITTDRHYRIEGEFREVTCQDCTLVMLDPMYSEEELTRLYPDDYYAYQGQRFEKNIWMQKLRSLLGLQIKTKDPVFPAPGRMLDLGCGSGWFLKEMQQLGWECYGVEVSRSGAETGRKLGVDVFCGTLEQAAFPDDHFDYIRSNHSFEHIVSPNETLQEVWRILKPSGKLLIGVPNLEGLNARLFGRYWWYLGAPVHPFNYSVTTLRRLLEKHRFQVLQIKYNSDYSGILGSIQIFLNRDNGRVSTEGWLYPNLVLKAVCHWAAKVLDVFRQGDAIEVVSKKAT